jgi:uncharacterized protein
MRIIALEEHFATPAVIAAWLDDPAGERDLAVEMSTGATTQRMLVDLADERIAYMDAVGIDVQVLSVTTTGVQNAASAVAIPVARAANDLMAATIRAHPDRFQGLATLPMSAPDAAAAELERAVTELGLHGAMIFGRHGERNLDHADFLPVLQTAESLRAPLYLHPQSPPATVRRNYYGGLGTELDGFFATAGIGWHYETGIQALRLILSGRLDQLPELQLILGHWGEVVLFYLDRIDLLSEAAGLSGPVSEYFGKHFSVTPGGILSERYLHWAQDVLGADRIMFATDYPFQRFDAGAAPAFLTAAVTDDADRERIASGNWERMTTRIRRCRKP